MSRRRTFTGVAVLALIGAACAPSNDINIGLKDYPTNVVYGDPAASTTVPPPPLPVASLSPGFPAFIVPAPPPLEGPQPYVIPPPPPPLVELTPDPCPIGTAASRRIAATPRVTGQPTMGAYLYNQQGTFKVGTAKPVDLPRAGAREVRNAKVVDGSSTWDVVIVEFGITTTTSYRLYRPSGRPEVDGLYITRVVQTAPGRTNEDFSPASPGLRILPEPAVAGAQWTSTANDPTHGVSVLLQGTIKEVRSIDVCGVFVEGWIANTSVNVRKPVDPAGADDLTTTQEYLVAMALGGLIIADNVKQTGSEDGVMIDRSTSSQLADLAPR